MLTIAIMCLGRESNVSFFVGNVLATKKDRRSVIFCDWCHRSSVSSSSVCRSEAGPVVSKKEKKIFGTVVPKSKTKRYIYKKYAIPSVFAQVTSRTLMRFIPRLRNC